MVVIAEEVHKWVWGRWESWGGYGRKNDLRMEGLKLPEVDDDGRGTERVVVGCGELNLKVHELFRGRNISALRPHF